jgi:hypothetical protein
VKPGPMIVTKMENAIPFGMALSGLPVGSRPSNIDSYYELVAGRDRIH